MAGRCVPLNPGWTGVSTRTGYRAATGARDPAERVAFAAEYLLTGVHAYEGSVRAMIAHTLTVPGAAKARPGIRFGLIDYALAPFEGRLAPEAMTQLKLDLAVAVSAEALFKLTDLCGLPPPTRSPARRTPPPPSRRRPSPSA